MSHPEEDPRPTRRAVVTGVGLCALAAVTGCAVYGRPAGSPAPAQVPAGRSGSAPPLALASDVPVGGGAVLTDAQVVVTQPVEGRFMAFSAVCTHQGCVVNAVADGTINCPCHGSRFAIADGSVTDGPAKRGLPRREITAQGGELRLA